MALAANANYTVRDTVQLACQAVTAAELYNGAYLYGGSRDHATAINRGRIAPWSGVAGQIPLGFASKRTTGNTAVVPIVEGEVDLGGRVMKNIAVTGLAGTVADNFRVVYATDDNTFTLVRPAVGHPVGIVTRFISATNCDVYFLSFGELCVLGMAGAGRKSWLLGIVNGLVSTGNHATGIVAPCHGRILSTYGIVFEPITDVNANGNINLEIAAVDVTGGVINFDFADVLGAKKAGSAVTATDVFHEGDLIDIECAEVAAGTAIDGYMAVYADVLLEPGL
jgi:hypothetical protein